MVSDKEQKNDDKNKDAVHVTINMTAKALFNFMMINSFVGIGKVLWGLSFLALILLPVALIQENTKLFAGLLIVVLINFVSKPLRFKSNANQQIAQNETFKHPIQFSIGKEGVFISQFVGDGHMAWQQFNKVVEKKKVILLYITETQAFILIKEQMEERDIKQLRHIIKNVDGLKSSIKRDK